MTKLSVLVPHFNDPGGFLLSLRSIESQTWRGERKVIVCDDGSEPENLDRLRQILSESSEDVELILNLRNRGRPYTRNVLLDAAEGKYTAWLDAGDEWYPGKIQEQLNGLYRARFRKHDRPVWATCNYDWQWRGARKRLQRQEVDGDQIGSLLLSSLRAYLWTLLGPTETFKSVGYFDLELPRLQDLDFFLRFLTKGGMLVLPPNHSPLCVYHKSDLGRSGEEVLRCYNYLYNKHAPLLMGRSRRFRRNRRFELYLHAARFTSNNNDPLRTALYMGTSAFHNPVAFVRRMIKNKGQL